MHVCHTAFASSPSEARLRMVGCRLALIRFLFNDNRCTGGCASHCPANRTSTDSALIRHVPGPKDSDKVSQRTV